jgi:hypothetical protein
VVNEQFVDRWVLRLRNEVPEAIAIFLGGSHVRGDAGPHSDVDFDVLVADGPRNEWPAWFDTTGDRIVRVSTWIRDVDSWLDAQQEPQEWAFFLSCADPLRLCWAAAGAWGQQLDRTELVYPPAEPEIDHFQGEVAKVANAWARRDVLAVRLAAADLARSVMSLAQPLNRRAPVRSRNEALIAVLDFEVVPMHYRDDMLACLGFADRYVSADDMYAATCRLAYGILDLLDAHVSTFAAVLPAKELTCVRDGSLRRFVSQTFAEPRRCSSLSAP